MYKHFRTMNGKRMKVKMTEEEVSRFYVYAISLVLGGLMFAFFIWGAI